MPGIGAETPRTQCFASYSSHRSSLFYPLITGSLQLRELTPQKFKYPQVFLSLHCRVLGPVRLLYPFRPRDLYAQDSSTQLIKIPATGANQARLEKQDVRDVLCSGF